MNVLAVSSAIVVILAISCNPSSNGGTHAPTSTSPSKVSLGSLGSAGCKPSAIRGLPGGGALHEVGFDSNRGSFWALFFGSIPPRAGEEIKVVWRMTGSGDFTFRVSDSDGETIPLAWGPEGHGSSSWNHPGNEVGTGFKFPHGGCWDIHVAKVEVAADLWLEVSE